MWRYWFLCVAVVNCVVFQSRVWSVSRIQLPDALVTSTANSKTKTPRPNHRRTLVTEPRPRCTVTWAAATLACHSTCLQITFHDPMSTTSHTWSRCAGLKMQVAGQARRIAIHSTSHHCRTAAAIILDGEEKRCRLKRRTWCEIKQPTQIYSAVVRSIQICWGVYQTDYSLAKLA